MSKFQVGDVIVPIAGTMAAESSYQYHGHILEVDPPVRSGEPGYQVHWSDIGSLSQSADMIDSDYELAEVDPNG